MIDSRTPRVVDDGGYPAPAYAWYVVVVLMLAYMFSFIDRQILTLMVEPIKRDLGITDFSMSLLMGLSFALFYTVLGMPIGWLADRRSRRAIIASGISLWCLMTVACGLARNYGQLFLARVGVGVGEAALSPAALSMISDYFPPQRRARAIGFYTLGVSIGSGLAYFLGGAIIARAPSVSVPLIGELYPWQTVFVLVGLPGLLVAALMATVKEPERRDKIRMRTASGQETDDIPLMQVVRFLAHRWRTYGSLFLGMSVVTILGYGFLSWIPAMFTRNWEWTPAEIGFAYGVVVIIWGPTGVFFGGWMADMLFKRGHKNGHALATLAGALLSVPTHILLPLMPTPALALAFLCLTSMSAGIITATGPAALMTITPNQMRAQASAVYYFVINVIGLTVGPSAVAYFTDFVFKDEAYLRYSLSIVSVLSGVFALGFLFYLQRHYIRSVEEAEGWFGVSAVAAKPA